MYQELKILRRPLQWKFCTKGKGDSDGRIETGEAEKKSSVVGSHVPDDRSVKSSFVLFIIMEDKIMKKLFALILAILCLLTIIRLNGRRNI